MSITTDDRKEINTALAKAIAYVNCGKQKDAEKWARELVRLLECSNILNYDDNEIPPYFQNTKTH